MLKIRTLLKFKNGLYKSPAFLNNKNFKSFHLQISLNFSEKNNKNKVPEGFEKFKRTSKAPKNESSQEQKIENIELKKNSNTDRNKISEEEKEPSPQKEDQNEDQNKKIEDEIERKFFSYFPKLKKMYYENKNTNESKSEEKEKKSEEEEKIESFIKNNYKKLDFWVEFKKQEALFKKFLKNFNVKYGLGTKQYLIALIFLSMSFAMFFSWLDPFDKNAVNFEEFQELFSQERILKIQMNRTIDESFFQTHAKIFLSNGEIKFLTLGNIDHFLEKLENLQTNKGKSSDTFIPVEFNFNNDPYHDFDRFSHFIYVITTGLLIIYVIKSSPIGKSKQGLSKTKIYGIDTNIQVKFKDVAGLDEAKIEINEFVDFLKKPFKYKEMGARLPKGALLTGPPGTGKTMLAKACAGEAGVPFLYLSGSDFVEMFVGVGASRVRDLFKQAKENSPSIIFIDEIDAVGKKREANFGGHDERDNTLNQLLVEMDGFGTDVNVNKPLFYCFSIATNQKEVLDTALTRPGRFDRLIEVNLPDLEGRKEIFLVHLKNLKLEPSKTIQEYAARLATLTPGFSGADISNLCNEAAILAARKNKLFVDSSDFELSSERVIAGLERKKLISEEEKKTVAYHESGHAVVSWFLEGGNPLLKLTIIPRSKGSLGFAQYLPNENTLETKEELKDKIACILGGRCSEEEFFGKVTTGASDDFQKAYSIANAMVIKYGMSENLGYIAFKEEEFVKKHSEATQNKIDQEIKQIIQEATEKSRKLVKTYKKQIENLAKNLIEKETLDLDSIIEILGERPFEIKTNFKAFLESKNLTKA